MSLKFFYIIYIFNISYIITKKFPIINEKIKESKIEEPKSINIKSYEEYINYIKNNNNIISLFHVNWCGHCRHLLPIIDKASSYEIINKKWFFLKIDCSIYSYICSILNINRYPYTIIYKDKKILYKEIPRELNPLLQFLYKILDSPLIQINSDEKNFLEKYGDISPIIEYNNKNSEFFICIKNLSENEFLEDFYFGIRESKNNKAKIIFNYNNNMNLPNKIFEWGNNCTNVFYFLNENKYPLLNEINSDFLKDISYELKTIIFVITFMENILINNFVFSEMKNLSYNNRKFIFGYADYTKDKYISQFFNINLDNFNQMKLIIYDFKKRMYYIHNNTFNFRIQNKNDIYNEIQNLIKNINKLKFTSGSKIKDLFSFINLEEMSPQKQMIVCGIFVLILLGIIYLMFHFSGSNNNNNINDEEDEFDEYCNIINEIQKDDKNKKIINKNDIKRDNNNKSKKD